VGGAVWTVYLPTEGGDVRRVMQRPLKGVMKHGTVSKPKRGKSLIRLQVAMAIAEPAFTGRVVGLDLGFQDFETLSGGEKMARPPYDRKAQRKRRRLAKSMGDAGGSQFVDALSRIAQQKFIAGFCRSNAIL
jgi:transposase